MPNPEDWMGASPLLEKSHTGLPPALIILADHDPLYDDGISYEKKLREAGIPTKVHVGCGMLHDYPIAHGTEATRAMEAIVAELQERFHLEVGKPPGTATFHFPLDWNPVHMVTEKGFQVISAVGNGVSSSGLPPREEISPDESRGRIRDYFDQTRKTVAGFSRRPLDRRDSRWAFGEKTTLAGFLVEAFYRVVQPFAPPEIFVGDAVANCREFLTEYFHGKMQRRVISVQKPDYGWDGDLEVYDSNPDMAFRPDIVTLVVSHGLTVPGGHVMYADVIRDYLQYLQQEHGDKPPVRVVTIAEPGHGDLRDGSIPSPMEFSYHPDAMGAVCWAALDKIGVSNKVIHLTESLGLNISWRDLLTAAVNGTEPRIREHVLAATSTEQMGFLLGFMGVARKELGGHSIAEALVETLPDWAIGYPEMLKLAQGFLGWNAGQCINDISMERMKDPRVTRAILAVLPYIPAYVEGGRLMYHAPVKGDRIRVNLLGTQDDLVMGTASMLAFDEGLRRNPGLRLSLYLEKSGGHFVMGRDKPIRQKHTELIIQATERLLGRTA